MKHYRMICFEVMTLFVLFLAGCQTAPAVKAESGGEIHGFVVADLSAQGKRAAPLPNAVVYVKNSLGKDAGIRVKTDGSGRFVIPEQPTGIYRVCAQAEGFTEKCDAQLLALGLETLYINPSISLSPSGDFLSGRLVMSDGTPCFHNSVVFGSRLQGEAHTLTADGKEIGKPVAANSKGIYVIPRPPGGQDMKLRLVCGSAQVDVPSSAETTIIPNELPRILALAATLAGKVVRSAPPGAIISVSLRAEDGDQDNLHYQWVSAHQDDFVSSDASEVKWKLSAANAANILFVEVRDGRGGFANGRIVIEPGAGTDKRRARLVDFSGRALEKDGVSGNRFFVASALEDVVKPVPSHGLPFLSYKNTACEGVAGKCIQETQAYYESIGATSGKETLSKFRAANGFDQGETTAIYYNAGDLGFGREMHCRQSAGADADVACYVTNYGPPGGDASTALAQAIAHDTPVATVGMDYSLPLNGTTKVVKFYVWDGNGNLTNRATLDSEGPKSVPQICLVCHGGRYIEATHSVRNASFREFDIFSFGYSDQEGYRFENQIEKFRVLNQMVKASKPNPNNANQPITALIDGMYPPNSAPNALYVPPGWVDPGKSDLYTRIPRTYCRACHIAQSSGIDWTSYAQFTDRKKDIEDLVCSDRTMPHGEVPFKRFWLTNGDSDYLASAQTGLGFTGSCPTP